LSILFLLHAPSAQADRDFIARPSHIIQSDMHGRIRCHASWHTEIDLFAPALPDAG